MTSPSEPQEAGIDLEKAKQECAARLRELESAYRKNQIEAIMEMGKEISGLHQKYSDSGQKHRWKAEFRDLQLRTSRRTAERYRKIYNSFHDCPALWNRFKLSAMIELAECADREGRRNDADAAVTCLLYIKTIAADWQGLIRRRDAALYCQAWQKFSMRPQLLYWFTFDALLLLMATGNESVINQAKYAAADLDDDAAAGSTGELIGVDQAQAIIENFAEEKSAAGETSEASETPAAASSESTERFEYEADSSEEHSARDDDDEESESDEDSEIVPDVYDEIVEEPEADAAAAEHAEIPALPRRKFMKTFKLSRCDISIAADIEPKSPEDIESILDELRAIMQAAFENQLAAAE